MITLPVKQKKISLSKGNVIEGHYIIRQFIKRTIYQKNNAYKRQYIKVTIQQKSMLQKVKNFFVTGSTIKGSWRDSDYLMEDFMNEDYLAMSKKNLLKIDSLFFMFYIRHQ